MDIESHPFFRNMPPETMEVVARLVTMATPAKGEVLFRQGDAANNVVFILDGEIALGASVPGGAEAALAVIGSGELLGELSLMTDHRRSATATVARDATLAMIDTRDLEALCAQYHPASLSLLCRLAEIVAYRLRETTVSAAHQVDEWKVRQPGVTEKILPRIDFEFRRFLPSLPFFQGFTDAEIDAFTALCERGTAPAGCPVRDPTDGDSSCYVIVRGAVQNCVVSERGTLRSGVLGPGRVFGDVAWLLGESAAVQTTTISRCSFLRLPASARSVLRDPTRRLSFRVHQALLRGLQVKLDAQSRDLARREQIRISHAQRWED